MSAGMFPGVFAAPSSYTGCLRATLIATCGFALSACSDDASSDAGASGAGASGGSGNASGAAGAPTGGGGTTGSDAAVDAGDSAATGGTGGSPYACGWIPRDPGNLVATGPNEGDVIENIPLIDQCGDQLPLWDVAGEYHLLFMTTVW